MIVFPDPLSAALRILRSSTHPELAAASFGTWTPEDLGDDYPGAPYVMLSLVGGSGTFPFSETASVSLLAYGATPAKALRLAQLTRAALTAYLGDSEVGSVTAGPRPPIPTRDPDSDAPVATTLVAIRLLPTQE